MALLVAYLLLRPSVPSESRMTAQALCGRLAAEPNLQLVDVRTPAEFAEQHLKGAKIFLWTN